MATTNPMQPHASSHEEQLSAAATLATRSTEVYNELRIETIDLTVTEGTDGMVTMRCSLASLRYDQLSVDLFEHLCLLERTLLRPRLFASRFAMWDPSADELLRIERGTALLTVCVIRHPEKLHCKHCALSPTSYATQLTCSTPHERQSAQQYRALAVSKG